jgi:DNA-binding NarL/FixJ family response regulator
LQEREIVRMIGKGYPEWHIGERLRLSPERIQQQVQSIGTKIGVRNRIGLAVFALGHEL